MIVVGYDFDVGYVLLRLGLGAGEVGPVYELVFVVGQQVGTCGVLGCEAGCLGVVAQALVGGARAGGGEDNEEKEEEGKGFHHCILSQDMLYLISGSNPNY